MAEQQAIQLTQEISQGEFATADLTILETLETERICYRNTGRIGFAHDLFADWSRQRLLLSETGDPKQRLLSRLDSPVWHRAIMLFGLDLLERQEDIKTWTALLSGADLLADLMLDAVIYAADAKAVLAKAWDTLQASEGRWLRRFLRRFLYIATEPNPSILRLAEKNNYSKITASTIYRWPISIFWAHVIRFISAHQADCIEYAPAELADITYSWLTLMPDNVIYRDEAAQIALTVAWKTLRYEQHRHWDEHWPPCASHNGEFEKSVYRAALAAVYDMPDAVFEFALCACGRRPPTEPLPPIEENQPEEFQEPLSPELQKFREMVLAESRQSEFIIEYIDFPPWPDGRNWDVDHHFQELCMNENGLMPLVFNDPNKASEIVLALSIREGGKRRSYELTTLRQDFELDNFRVNFFPSFYTNGPFLSLLQVSPEKGIEVIVKLTNLATFSWLEYQQWKQEYRPSEFDNDLVFTIRISHHTEEREWIGDYRWLYAYRDSAPPPGLLVSALMALEKWFYDCLDENKPIEEWVDSILGCTCSLALVGVLLAVGKRKPSLFLGPLKPFLSSPELYVFEFQHFKEGERYQMMGWTSWQHTEKQIEQAKKWHLMNHRQLQLQKIAVHLLLTEASIEAFFKKVRQDWQQRLSKLQHDDLYKEILSDLIIQFDPIYWKASDDSTQWHFQPPEEFLTQAIAAEQQLNNQQLLLWFPMHCRQILDGEESASDDQLAQLRQQGHHLLSLDIEKLLGEERFLRSSHDIACALAALALCVPGKWLEDWPDYKTWCRQKLLDAIFTPPPVSKFDTPEAINNSAWDRFCADALPILWADSPKDKQLRQAVAYLCSNRHYETVLHLFKSASKLRNQLGEEFMCLEHFVIRLSVIRDRLLSVSSELSDREKSSQKQLKKELYALINKFSADKLSSQTPLWRDLKHTFITLSPSRFKRLKMYIHRKLKPSSSQEEGYPFFKRKTFFPRSPGLDLIFIQYAFAWLPPLSSAQTIQEKQHWLDFWLQCVDLLQWTVGEGKPDIQKIEGTPYEFDRWVFKHLPNILLYVDDPKVERDLWEPILRLGQPGEHWAEDFLQEWFLSGARVTKRHDAFVRIWQDMLAYVETHPNWHMWCSMMGWESIALEFLWTEDSAKLLAQRLSPDYERWAKKHLNDHRNVECLCRFLETPAATSIFGQGIQWLADALPPDGFWYDAYQQIENSLVRLLAQYHTQHGTLHGLDAKQRESFLRLLRALVERHNKQAMALQEAILNV